MIDMKKRGLSDVVTTVLLVLVSLAAVAIIVGVVLPQLRSGLKSVNTAACIGFEIQPISCVIADGNNASVTYKWTNGDISLAGVKLVLESTDGNSKVIDGDTLNRLETATMYNVTFKGTPGKFTVSGVLKSEDGSTTPCSEYATKVVCK